MTQLASRPTPVADAGPSRVERRTGPGRTLRLLAVDGAFFVAFVAIMDVTLTGLTLHEVLGLGVFALTVVHLVQHAGWVASTTRRFFSRCSLTNRVDYVMMVLLFVAFVAAAGSGLVISEVLVPATGLDMAASPFWLWLHVASATAIVWLTALHIALNWKWIVSTFDRHVFGRLRRSGEEA